MGKKKIPTKNSASDNTKSGNNNGGETQHTKGNDEEEKLTLVNNLKKQANSPDTNSIMTNPSKIARSDLKVQNVSSLRRKLRKFVRSKPVIAVIIILVVVYTILIFVDITLAQFLSDSDLNSVDSKLRYVELIILIIF